jgi:MarR family transcriptional regulator, organic hydroperoxide resistance regulator
MKDTAKQVAEIVDNIRRVFQVVNEQSQKVKRETGLTGPQIWTIKTILDAAPLSVKELARRVYLHPATVVGIVDRLEENGYVTRTRSLEDRRVVLVALTAKGRKLVANAPAVIQGMLITGLEKLPAKKRKIIDDGFIELVKMLGIETMPPQLILSQELNVRSRTKSGAGRGAKEIKTKRA